MSVLDKQNKKYVRPTITVVEVNMENCISAMSTTINPVNSNGQLEIEDWQVGQDSNSDYTW